MNNYNLITIFLSLLLIHVIASSVFSKTVLELEPQAGRRIRLLGLLWLLPVFGALLVYKLLELQWFSNEDDSNRTGGISFSFLELDSVFNPGSKHVLEEQQREKMEIKKQGKDLDDLES